MKPTRFSTSRSFLGTGISVCFAAVSAAAILAGSVASGAAVYWNPNTLIAGDSDVLASGTLSYAYNFNNTAAASATVNGVAFTGTNAFTGTIATNLTLSGLTANGANTFGGATGTYAALSASYRNLLVGASYGGAGAGTVTLNNLTVGQTYAVQLWINDSRTFGSARTAVITSAGGNSVTLDYNNTETTGGVGQHVTGVFTADATTQAFTITGSASSQINSIQLRNITAAGAPGVWNTLTNNQPWSTAGNWASSFIANGSGFIANFNTLNPTADTTVRLDSSRTIGGLIFGDTTVGTAASWTLDNNGTSANVLTLAGTAPSVTVNALGTNKLSTISANIAGTSGLLKSGAGILSLTGTNTFTGGVTLAAGTLRFSADAALGNSANAVTFSGASTLQLGATLSSNTRGLVLNAASTLDTNGFNLTHSGTISGTGALTKAGTGTLTLSGTNTNSGGVSVSGGTLIVASPSALGALPATTLVNSIAPGSNTVEFATDVSVNAYNLNVGSNTNSTFRINRATSGAGVTHNVGSILGGTGSTINFTSGTNNTSTPTVISSTVILSSGFGNSGQYTLNPTGVNLQINGPIGNTSGSTNVDKGLTLSGTSTGNIISGVISNGSNAGTGKLPLVKSGIGTWTLSGANTYTGITNVTAGTLAIGTGGSISNSPVVNVTTGATLDATAAGLTLASGQTLIGAGSLTGSISTSSGARIAPGNTPTTATGNAITGAVGTITASSLTLASGTVLDFEFGTGNDQITVSTSSGLAINGGAINLYATGGTTPFSTNGTYTLFNYSGTLGGTGTSALSIANAQVGKLYNFADTGSAITLTISDAPTPADWAVDASGSWADALNWSTNPTIPNGASALAYLGGTTSPAFSSQWTVTLDGGKTVGSLTINNGNGFIVNQGTGGSLSFDNGSATSVLTNTSGINALNVPVTITSAGLNASIDAGTEISFNGAIATTGNITQSGTGKLILGADNTSYTGTTTIGSGGTLQVGSASTAGSLGSGAVVNNGTLLLDRSDSALVATNNISGTGSIANNSTTGSITLSGNISTSSSVTNNSAGTLVLSGNNTYTGSTNLFGGVLVASGGSAIPNSGAVSIFDAAGVLLRLDASETIGTLNGGGTNGGDVNLQSNTLSITGAGNSVFSGIISGTGGSLAKSGGGTLTLSGANTFTGGLSMSAGIAVAGSASAFGTGTVNINTGSTRFVVNDGVTFANNITINGGGASSRGLLENSGAGTATLSGTITVNSLTTGGGHFGSTGGGILAITGPINSSVPLTSRIGTVVVSGGGNYSTIGVGEGTLTLGANNGVNTAATLDVGNIFTTGVTGSFDLAGFNQTVAGLTRSGTANGVVGNSSTAADSTLTVTGTSSYSGVIRDNLGLGDKKVLLVVDGGNLTVSGASLFTGGTTLVNNATVNVAGGGGLSNGTVAIPAGSTLNTTAQATFTFKPTGAGTLNFTNLGTGTASTILNVDNTGFTGTVNVGPSTAIGGGKIQLNSPTASSATINVLTNATLYSSAAVTHTAPLVLNGGDTGENLGQLRLEGGSNWSGPVTLAGAITGAGDFTIGGNTTTGTISGNIGETGGARALSKGGSGTITLSGANTYSGLTTVATGALVAGSSAALGTTDAGTVVASGASLRLANGITVTGESVTITGNGGNARGALQADNGASATWAGPVLISATVDSRIGAQANGTLTVSGAISSSGGADLVVSADVVGAKVVLTGTNNTYTGQTQIVRGLLQLGATNTLPTGSTLNIHNAASVADAASVDLNGFNQQVGGLLRGNNSGPATLTNASVTASTLTISNTAAFTYDSPITGNLSLVKSGTGTQTLTGTSTYTGSTTVNGGVLNVNSSSALGDGSATNTLVLNGGTLQAGGAITSPSTRGVTLSANSTVDTVANAVSIAGVVSGTSNLTKNGTGTLTLSGANTYTGNTVVNAGTLELTSTSQQAFTIGANGVNTSISGTGTVTIDGTFNLNLAGADITTGNSWTLVNVATLTESFTTNFNIPGFTQAADVWTMVDGTKTWTFTESTGVLSLTVSSGAYATWASDKGLTAGVNDGKDQDPDNDGRTNAMEFAFDGNPLSAANDGKVSSKIASVGGNNVLTLTVPVRSSATFSNDGVTNEEVSAVIDTLVYRIQGSSDLSAWTRDVSEVTDTGDLTAIQAGLPTLSSGWTYRSFRAPGTVAADAKDFLRAVIQPQ
jgi:fibronectin-binding autotransporter adhesin